MNSPFFNEHFINISLSQDLDCFNTIYNEDPIYFIATSDEDTNQQLIKFRGSSSFTVLKNQIEMLLDKMDQWCCNHNIQETFPQKENISAFSLFKERLLGSTRYFDIREAVLFNLGKKALEELVLLLENDQIPVNGKKDVLFNLQKGIVVCSDGVLTNVEDATDDLRAYTGINKRLHQIKVTLIQQSATTEIKKRYPQINGNEIHYVNAYYNFVAQDYGLEPREDTFIDVALKTISLMELHEFKDIIKKQFTPALVLNNLMDKFKEDWHRLYHALLKDLDNNPCIKANESEKVDRILFYLKQWNQKYAALLKLDVHDLAEAKDSGDFMLHDLTALDLTLSPQVIKNFSERYLNQDRIVSLRINDDLHIFYCHKLLWCEHQGIPELITQKILRQALNESISSDNHLLHHFLLAAPDETLTYLFELKKTDQLHASTLINRALDAMYYCNDAGEMTTLPWYLVFYREWDAVNLLLKKELVTTKHLATTPLSGAYQEVNILQLLVKMKQWLLIKELLRQKLITSEQLDSTSLQEMNKKINIPGLLACNNQWGIIKELIQQNLITSELLTSSFIQEDEYQGMNALWILANHSQWDIIQELIYKNLISSAHLSFKPVQGASQGRNILWLLAANQRWQLLHQILRNMAITSEQLSSQAEQAEDKGVNILWILVRYSQWGLLKKCLEQKLITSAQLLAMPQQGEFQGQNILWMLATQLQNELFIELLNQKLITAAYGPSQGKSVLWLLARYQQWEIIKELLCQKLITSAQVHSASPKQTGISSLFLTKKDEGKNALSFFAEHHQRKIVRELGRQNLITAEELFFLSPQKEKQEKKVKYSLFKHDEPEQKHNTQGDGVEKNKRNARH